ncbi:MAG: zinc ABC transporter substrate-binding protein [Thiogranum sp.]|nr:zinc ABC transporter substrate-binding protein [Thiogranum sp.]
MKHVIAVVISTLVLLPAAVPASVRVFSCEPEWASLVTELAGERADVFTATTPRQDPHYIQARPSLIAQLRNADLLVCTGAGLEAGWLPVLLRRAGNPRVQPGTERYIQAADHVPMLDVPQRLDRSEGDIHAEGNPHIQLDPRNIARVAKVVAERLAVIEPDHSDYYRSRLEDFQQRWQAAMQHWEQRAAPLRDMPIVVHHPSWTYFNHWLGLRQIATLEPRPGVAPGSRHLSQLLATLQETPALAVIRAPYQDAQASQWLASRTSIAMIEMPFTVGGNAQASDLFGLFEASIDLLLDAQR